MAGRKRKENLNIDRQMEESRQERERVQRITTWRSTKYDFLIADEICERIASGESLASITRSPGMPSKAAIYNWMRQNEEFREMYRFAVEMSGLTQADDLLDLANKVEDGTLDPKQAYPIINIKTWMAERRAPKHYSPKQQVEMTGKDGGAIEIKDSRDFARRLAFSLAKGVYEPVNEQ